MSHKPPKSPEDSKLKEAFSLLAPSARLRVLREGSPKPPPNLRDATSASKCCQTCEMFFAATGECWGYANYEVRPDQVCDSWEKEEESG